MTSILAFQIVITAIFGAVFGSFLNVVIYRVPAGKSLLTESRCPNCNNHIKWWQNIPIFSWLFLRGKCFYCKKPISPRYMIVEGLVSLLFALTTFFYPVEDIASGLQLLGLLVFVSFAVALSFIDLDTHKLPNALTFPSFISILVILSLSAAFSKDYSNLLRAILASLLVALVYFALALVKKSGMGLGDVKWSLTIGLILGWFGWGNVFIGGFGAFFIAALYSIILMVTKKAKMTSGIPFGPWMSIGAWLGIIFGTQILNAYISIITI